MRAIIIAITIGISLIVAAAIHTGNKPDYTIFLSEDGVWQMDQFSGKIRYCQATKTEKPKQTAETRSYLNALSPYDTYDIECSRWIAHDGRRLDQ